jgi:hypothetical protein
MISVSKILTVAVKASQEPPLVLSHIVDGDFPTVLSFLGSNAGSVIDS